ncbi:hypothetical protein MLD38_016030 [Melastoma candidum]|uniref:Uncharacterized protein n=1 Tax=Melastoma candidum TaxID=119954 RepID=A0ACB9RHV1_9MYRT|nr:hypothetical protein MLD38_016030 [Melastoma candidum]
MAATTAATISSSSSLLGRKIPSLAFPLRHSSSSSPSIPANLSCPSLSLAKSRRRGRGLCVRADSDNGADTPVSTILTSSPSVLGAGVCVPPALRPILAPRSRCVLRGCVPKKLLVYASKYSHEFEESRGFGWKYETDPEHDWSTLIANKNAELQRLTGIYKNIWNNAGVTLIEGRGKIVDPHTVDFDGKLYTARNILISVGGRPFILDIPGKEYAIDSDAALDLPSQPKKIAIKVLRGFDEEIRDFVSEQMSLRGIEFHNEESPQAIQKLPDGSLSLKTTKGTVEGFSHIMFAIGRKPNTKNLGLEAVGLNMKKNGAIEVDEFSETSVPSIWAVGDFTDRVNLTPVALMEGGALAKTLILNEPTKPDYRNIPSAAFCQPPIGQVGLTEEQAVQEYGDVDVFTANFRPLKATISGLPDRVFMKLIVCAKTNEVLGLHMYGEDAPEIVQGFAVAIKAGLTKADFDSTVGIHPTAAEELVTMRTPTRKIRSDSSSEGEKGSDAKAAAGV